MITFDFTLYIYYVYVSIYTCVCVIQMKRRERETDLVVSKLIRVIGVPEKTNNKMIKNLVKKKIVYLIIIVFETYFTIENIF